MQNVLWILWIYDGGGSCADGRSCDGGISCTGGRSCDGGASCDSSGSFDGGGSCDGIVHLLRVVDCSLVPRPYFFRKKIGTGYEAEASDGGASCADSASFDLVPVVYPLTE